MISDESGGMIANDASVRLVNYSVMVLFNSIKLENTSGEIFKYMDHCHPNLLM